MKTILLATALALAPVLAVPAFAATDPAPAGAASASPRAKMMFWFLDRNADGVIDATEITAFRTARFNALDSNGDGKLTKDEATADLKRGPGHGPRHGKGPDGAANAAAGGDQAEGRKAHFAERQAKRQERMLERLGFTGDVTEVTLTQFLALPNPMVTRADADKDGRITQAEFLAISGKGRGPTPN